MTPIQNTSTIGADGEYVFQVKTNPGEPAFIELDGVFGGATVTPGYVGLSGEFVASKGLDEAPYEFTESFFVGVDTPRSSKLAISVSGAGGSTSIRVAAYQDTR